MSPLQHSLPYAWPKKEIKTAPPSAGIGDTGGGCRRHAGSGVGTNGECVVGSGSDVGHGKQRPHLGGVLGVGKKEESWRARGRGSH
jgi:hypothetical protein